jgi:hypothetical protein
MDTASAQPAALSGAGRRTEAFVNAIFLALRPVPPLAWIPLAIVWLGLGDAAKPMEERTLAQGPQAFVDLDQGKSASAKIVLRP